MRNCVERTESIVGNLIWQRDSLSMELVGAVNRSYTWEDGPEDFAYREELRGKIVDTKRKIQMAMWQ